MNDNNDANENGIKCVRAKGNGILMHTKTLAIEHTII